MIRGRFRLRHRQTHLRRMRIELDTRASADALTDYLRRCACIVAYVDERTLEAAPPPRSQSDGDAEIELEAYLRVWEALNPRGAVIPRNHTTATRRIGPILSSS